MQGLEGGGGGKGTFFPPTQATIGTGPENETILREDPERKKGRDGQRKE